MTRWPEPPARGILVDPPVREWSALAGGSVEVDGRSRLELAHWRAQARAEACAVAREAAAEHGSAAPTTEQLARPWLVTGHQPGLVHPGIWTRFLLLDRVANGGEWAGFELVVDTDLTGAHVLAVPRLDSGARVVQTELAAASDLVDGFRPGPEPARVSTACAQAITAARTLPDAEERVAALTRFHERAVDLAGAHGSLATWAVASRRAHERERAPVTAVLPLSRLAGTTAFRRFVALVCRDAPAFFAAHAAILGRFRGDERIRSRSHPAPDLRARGEELEVPFWVIRGGRRVPVFVAPRRELVVDGMPRLRLPEDLDEAALALARADVSIVPRAATLTAYVRLLLADLFVHGTGGARYEPFVDAVLADALGLRGCPFVVATATIDLGGERGAVQELHRARTELDRCTRHPGAWASSRTTEIPETVRTRVGTLLVERAQVLEAPPGARRGPLADIDRRLAVSLKAPRVALERRIADLTESAAAESLLAARTWPYPLFAPAPMRSRVAEAIE